MLSKSNYIVCLLVCNSKYFKVEQADSTRMGLEADLLLELGGENVTKQDDGKEKKQTEKKESDKETIANGKGSSKEMIAKEKEGNDGKEVNEDVLGNKNVNCKDETDELQVCDKPSCTNSANKKCSRCLINSSSPSSSSTSPSSLSPSSSSSSSSI